MVSDCVETYYAHMQVTAKLLGGWRQEMVKQVNGLQTYSNFEQYTYFDILTSLYMHNMQLANHFLQDH